MEQDGLFRRGLSDAAFAQDDGTFGWEHHINQVDLLDFLENPPRLVTQARDATHLSE